MIATAINEALAAARANKATEVVKLSGVTAAAHAAIVGNGGVHIADGHSVWCRSDTCAHNSHDPGQDWSQYEVPTSWISEAKDPAVEKVFAGRHDTSNMSYAYKLVIPSDPPVAIQTGGERHYADVSRVVHLTAVAADA